MNIKHLIDLVDGGCPLMPLNKKMLCQIHLLVFNKKYIKYLLSGPLGIMTFMSYSYLLTLLVLFVLAINRSIQLDTSGIQPDTRYRIRITIRSGIACPVHRYQKPNTQTNKTTPYGYPNTHLILVLALSCDD